MLLNIYKLQCNIGVDFLKIEIGTNEAGQRLDKFLRKYLKDVLDGKYVDKLKEQQSLEE